MEITKIGTEKTNPQYDEKTKKSVENAQKIIEVKNAEAHELVDAISALGKKYNPETDMMALKGVKVTPENVELAALIISTIVDGLSKIYEFAIKVYDGWNERNPKQPVSFGCVAQ